MGGAVPDPHKLCLACGLCCRGGWFASGELGQNEVVQAKTIGLHVVEEAPGQVALRLPCPKFENGCCSIYASWRPAVCGAYSCALLKKYVAAEIGEQEAMKLVTSAVEMFNRVVAETGDMEGGIAGPAFLRLLAGDANDLAPGGRRLSPVAKMDAVALRVFFDRHFRKPGDSIEPSESPPQAPDADGR